MSREDHHQCEEAVRFRQAQREGGKLIDSANLRKNYAKKVSARQLGGSGTEKGYCEVICADPDFVSLRIN